MSTGSGNERGASGKRSPANEKTIAYVTIAGPTPRRFCRRFAESAPAIDPSEPTANAAPIATEERCSTRTA